MAINRYLDTDSYNKLKEQGLIDHQYNLRVRWIPSAWESQSDLGWIKYETVTKGGKLLSELSKENKKFTVRSNALYVNEAFIRILDPYPIIHSGDNGDYRMWVCAHVPNPKKNDIEEFVTWPVSGRVAGVIVSTIQNRGINKDNIHEYMFRVFRTGKGFSKKSNNGIWNLEVYFRDKDMPKPTTKFNRNGYFESEKTGCNLSEFKVVIPYQPNRLEVFDNKFVEKGIDFLKDVIIPLRPKRPTKEDYMDWLISYCLMEEDEIEKVYEYRHQVRLP